MAKATVSGLCNLGIDRSIVWSKIVMAYPKWMTWSSIFTTAMGTHQNVIYYAVYGEGWLNRIDDWCEDIDIDEIRITETRVATLSGSGHIRTIYSAQGFLWISRGSSLFKYDVDADVLYGPWTSGYQDIEDLCEYNGEIYAITRRGGSQQITLIKFTGAGFSDIYLSGVSCSLGYWTPMPLLEMVVFGDNLYFSEGFWLSKYDGSTISEVHDFEPRWPTAFNVVGSILYVGIGFWTDDTGHPYWPGKSPQLYSWDGSTMTFICIIYDHPRYFTRELAYRAADNTMYATTSGWPICWKIDLTTEVSTSDVNLGYVNNYILYRATDDTLWSRELMKVWAYKPCVVVVVARARTYFFLG